MLWHEQFAPGSFNLPCLARRYRGSLDVPALEAALSEIIRRHEPLRTSFEVVNGEPHQVVRDAAPIELAVTDLSGLAPGSQEAQLSRVMADASTRPFDLLTDPLFSPFLVALGRHDHVLMVRLHHLVFDDWSVDVFRKELSALYAASAAGQRSPLPALATGYSEASRWQRQRLASAVGENHRDHWRRALQGAPLAVQMPLHNPDSRAGAPQALGEVLRHDLAPALTGDLRALARRLRATPFMTALAGFQLLVSRYTGQDDVLIASAVANRNRSDFESLIGCFTKKFLLRVQLSDAPSFEEFVTRSRHNLLEALAHQELGFEAMLKESLLRPANAHGVVPTINVMFQAEVPRRVELTLPGISVEPLADSVAAEPAHFSVGARRDEGANDQVWGDGTYLGTFVIVSLMESDSGLSVLAKGVFDRSAGRRMLADFEALLTDAVAHPSRRVTELSSLSPRDSRGAPADDCLEIRGFRVRRAPLEAVIAEFPGVDDVAVVRHKGDGGEAWMAAYVVVNGHSPPTLADVRRAIWATHPGTMCPAAVVNVHALPRRPDGGVDVDALPMPRIEDSQAPDRVASFLAELWSELHGTPVAADRSYWQDFAFLDVLAHARGAGLQVASDDVARARTLELLAAVIAARRPPWETGARPVDAEARGVKDASV